MTILTLAFLVCLGIQQSNGAKLAVKAELDAAAMAYAPTAGLKLANAFGVLATTEV